MTTASPKIGMFTVNVLPSAGLVQRPRDGAR